MATGPQKTKGRCACPYCDAEIEKARFPYCQACKVEVLYCPKCHQPVPRGEQSCPACGADVRGGVVRRGK